MCEGVGVFVFFCRYESCHFKLNTSSCVISKTLRGIAIQHKGITESS